MSTDAPAESLEELVAQEAAALQPPPGDAPAAPEPPPEPTDDTPPEPADDLPPPEPTEDEPTEDERLLELDKLTNRRFSSKYKTYEEACQGIDELVSTVGRSDEDRETGRVIRDLRQKYGDQVVDKALARIAEPPPTATPAPEGATESPLPASYEMYETVLKAAQAKEGQPGFETDADYRRGVEMTRALSRETFEAIRDFRAMKKELGEVREQLTSQQQASQATTSEQSAQTWWGTHQAEMCQGGDWEKLTPLGKRTFEIVQEDDDCAALVESRGVQAALDVARAKAMALQPKPKPTREVSPQSVHQPGVAPSEHRALTHDELAKSGLKGPALLEALNEASRGGAQ